MKRTVLGVQFEMLNDKWRGMYQGWRITLRSLDNGGYSMSLADPLSVATESISMSENGWAGHGRGYSCQLSAYSMEMAVADSKAFIDECIGALSYPTPLRSPR